MNSNKIILIALATLLLGVGIGYFLPGDSTSSDKSTSEVEMNHGDSMTDTMSGMTSGLSGKTGEGFDEAFLQEMIVHHEGAVEMAQLALTNAKHDEIKTMAKAIIAAQNAEIVQMKAWQVSWFK